MQYDEKLMAIFISEGTRESVRFDWRTGKFTCRQLSIRYDISKSSVANIVKGIPHDLVGEIDEAKERMLLLKQADGQDGGQEFDKIAEFAAKKALHEVFFQNNAITVIQLMMTELKAACERGRVPMREFKDALAALHGAMVIRGVSPVPPLVQSEQNITINQDDVCEQWGKMLEKLT